MQRHALLDWLRLALVPGVTPAMQRALVNTYGDPRTALAANRDELRLGLGEEAARALAAGPPPALLDKTLRWLDTPGNHVLALDDPRYPGMLRQIHDPPAVLYARGRLELLNTPAIAIVGSRNASPQGRRDARSFGEALSGAGLTIVSGLALGIDTAAHRGGLARGGSSVALVGTGIDVCYPRDNKALAREIEESGCLVSEFPLGMPPLPWNFLRRNRLISGVSLGVVVVEANLRSGSLVTARHALAQNREVFAVPGTIHSTLSKGCHKLIKDAGAKLVDSVADILEELGLRAASAPRSDAIAPVAHPLLDAMGHGPMSIDEIVDETGSCASAIAAQLTRLELEGAVCALPGGRYQRTAG